MKTDPTVLILVTCCAWWAWGVLGFVLGRWTKGRRIIIEHTDYPRKLADRKPAAPYVTPKPQ